MNAATLQGFGWCPSCPAGRTGNHKELPLSTQTLATAAARLLGLICAYRANRSPRCFGTAPATRS
jgi:hypothetical protein